MLLNHLAAFEWIKNFLPSLGYKVESVTLQNRGRHILLRTIDSRGRYNYFYCIFKHTPVHSFNYLMKIFVDKYPEFAGYGESINVEYLAYARIRDSTILYIYPDHKVYAIDSRFLYKFVHEHQLTYTQKKENSYKVQYGNGVTEIVQEQEYLFPIKLFARMN